MSDWKELRARQVATDPRTSAQRAAGRAAASLRFDLAQLVSDLRTGAGLTQRELADRMGDTIGHFTARAGRTPSDAPTARSACERNGLGSSPARAA